MSISTSVYNVAISKATALRTNSTSSSKVKVIKDQRMYLRVISEINAIRKDNK